MLHLGRPTRLVTFASERLWPQLDALAQWGQGLHDVHLVIAHGDEEAGGPADRLETFLNDVHPEVAVHRHGPVFDDDPPAVTTIISAVIGSVLAGDQSWIIDASGGTRPMFAGAVRVASQHPSIPVVFRDARGPWLQMMPDGTARPVAGVDVNAMERFTLSDLLAVTWADDARQARTLRSGVEPEIAEAARDIMGGTEWSRAFYPAADAFRRRIGRNAARSSDGFLFENLILGLLQEMNVAADDLAISASLYHGDRPVQEVDVVVNAHGRLHVIDCKLADSAKDSPIGVQVRNAYATRRELGDGADQYVMLRPNMVVPEEFRSLCAEYDIRVVDQVTLARTPLHVVLEQLVHPPLDRPPYPSFMPGRSARMPEDDGVFDLRAEFVQSREPLRIYDHGRVVVLVVALGKRIGYTRVAAGVEKLISPSGTVIDVGQNSAKTISTLVIRHGRQLGDAERLRRRLVALTIEEILAASY